MISLSEFIQVLVCLGAVTGVWVQSQIAVAKLKERLEACEKRQDQDHEFVNRTVEKLFDKIDDVLEKISAVDSKINKIEIELEKKANK